MFEEAFKNVLEGFKELLGKYKLEELEEIASDYIQSMSEEEELVEEEEEV